jgi:hypothetical protein
MLKFRTLLGFLSCGLALGYLVFTFIAYESKGRISNSEFMQASAVIFTIALLISLWAFWRGDDEDKNDKKRDEPNIF